MKKYASNVNLLFGDGNIYTLIEAVDEAGKAPCRIRRSSIRQVKSYIGK